VGAVCPIVTAAPAGDAYASPKTAAMQTANPSLFLDVDTSDDPICGAAVLSIVDIGRTSPPVVG
jgi:hypothetical protein